MFVCIDIHGAARRGDLEALRAAIKRGANVNRIHWVGCVVAVPI